MNMTDKLTDEQTIKALECCKNEDIDCEDCPVYDFCNSDPLGMVSEVLGLINRKDKRIAELQAENESLKEALKDLKREMSYMSSPNTIGDRHEMGCW